MTLIALNTSKEQQVFWTLTEWQGRFVWCFVLMLKHVFLEEKHEELKLEIEYRMEMFSFCSCSTIDLQLAHTYGILLAEIPVFRKKRRRPAK